MSTLWSVLSLISQINLNRSVRTLREPGLVKKAPTDRPRIERFRLIPVNCSRQPPSGNEGLYLDL